MADVAARLLLHALTRAALEPDGLPLWAGKDEPGLFPAVAKAKPVAERSKVDGYLTVSRTEAKGKALREICTLTVKGREYLAKQADPRIVLDDLLRVLEAREADAERLSDELRRTHESLAGLRSLVASVLDRLVPVTPEAGLDDHIRQRLAGRSEDYPLPELYASLAGSPTVGAFHDALRRLHRDHALYLHPWTGPLYALPEPPFALLVGHEIAYYASARAA